MLCTQLVIDIRAWCDQPSSARFWQPVARVLAGWLLLLANPREFSTQSPLLENQFQWFSAGWKTELISGSWFRKSCQHIWTCFPLFAGWLYKLLLGWSLSQPRNILCSNMILTAPENKALILLSHPIGSKLSFSHQFPFYMWDREQEQWNSVDQLWFEVFPL